MAGHRASIDASDGELDLLAEARAGLGHFGWGRFGGHGAIVALEDLDEGLGG